jgi:hypothetical protein
MDQKKKGNPVKNIPIKTGKREYVTSVAALAHT